MLEVEVRLARRMSCSATCTRITEAARTPTARASSATPERARRLQVTNTAPPRRASLEVRGRSFVGPEAAPSFIWYLTTLEHRQAENLRSALAPVGEHARELSGPARCAASIRGFQRLNAARVSPL